MNSFNVFINKQKGAALILSLLILLVMTLIGVTAMQTTTMEEKMAGNMNDMNVALQTAEAALRAGETDLEDLFSTADFTNTGGSGPFNYKWSVGTAPDPFANATWANDTSSKSYTAFTGNGGNGRYFIEKVGVVDTSSSEEQCLDQHGDPCTGGILESFRVTARGTGLSGTAVVILQSNYIR